jgi:AcrR family transcriptional regulator
MAEPAEVSPLTPRTGGRRKVPRAVREEQMLDVAEQVFAERGYHTTSVEAIAEGSGITKPMVYAYFGSKDGLYLACVERARGRLFAAIDEAAPLDAAPDEALWRGLSAFFTFVAEERTSWVVLFGEAMSHGGPFAAEAGRLRRQMARLVTQLLGEAAAAEGLEPEQLQATEPLAHALVGAAESVAAWWDDHPEQSKEVVAKRLMNLAWLGFGGLVRGEVWEPPNRESRRTFSPNGDGA